MSVERLLLSDGKVGTAGVVRIGGAVSRTAGVGAASVHRLLAALQERGMPTPRPLDLDASDGIERLTFVDGTTPTLPWPTWMADEALLTSAVRLLRQLHDATAALLADDPTWRALPWWRWVQPAGDDRPATTDSSEVICHGDTWPPNLVVRDGEAHAWIDWDFAQPGSRLDDLGSLAKHWAPLMSDARAAAHGWRATPDRARRLRLIADAYDHPSVNAGSLLDAAERYGQVTAASHRAWAAEGQRPFAVMVARGITDAIAADGIWLSDHRAELLA